jgi:hypothetical protein
MRSLSRWSQSWPIGMRRPTVLPWRSPEILAKYTKCQLHLAIKREIFPKYKPVILEVQGHYFLSCVNSCCYSAVHVGRSHEWATL